VPVLKVSSTIKVCRWLLHSSWPTWPVTTCDWQTSKAKSSSSTCGPRGASPVWKASLFYNELLDKYQDDGLEIIGIAVQSDYDAIQPIIDQYYIQYPILVGNKDVETAYRVIGFPTAFLIDRDGAIQHKLLGTKQVEEAEGEIRQMLDLES